MKTQRILALVLSITFIAAANAQDVIVALDMDPSQPGIQQSITVPPGTTTVDGIAVYIWDTTGQHLTNAIGCYQCSFRTSISMGHHRLNELLIGTVASLNPILGKPAINGHDHTVTTTGPSHAFNGPSIDYFANTQFAPVGPGPMQMSPVSPQFTTSAVLVNATPGDVYRFYLVDVPALVGGGAFSVAQPFSADAGGDAVPDMTPTTQGIDLDRPLTAPPAPFLVDYRDGPLTGGGAMIIIDGCYADCDQSTGLGTFDIFDFLCFQSAFVTAVPYACDCDTTTGPANCDIFDFVCFQNAFVASCP